MAVGATLAFPVHADEVAMITQLAPNIRTSVIEEAVTAMKCAQSHGVGGELLFKRLQVTDIAHGNEISTGIG
jgi:hypothetical protein